MAGSAIGGVTLQTAGLVLQPGNGSDDDWGVIRRSRKTHRCLHQKPWSGRITTPCQHPVIEPGETYLLTKQGYIDVDKLALDCAIAAGIIARTEESNR